MALAIYKSAEYWKMSAGFKSFGLVKILIRDQALYFAEGAYWSDDDAENQLMGLFVLDEFPTEVCNRFIYQYA